MAMLWCVVWWCGNLVVCGGVVVWQCCGIAVEWCCGVAVIVWIPCRVVFLCSCIFDDSSVMVVQWRCCHAVDVVIAL